MLAYRQIKKNRIASWLRSIFMAYDVHKDIGKYLKNLENELNVKVVLARECGGNQNIPLFLHESKSNETEICNVDAMIIKDDTIRVLIEIEVSDTRPTQVCGKYLTSNLAKFYIHKQDGKETTMTLKKSGVLFIQIIDSTKFPKKSSKQKQLENIEKATNAVIGHGCIKKYTLVIINGNALRLNHALLDELKEKIQEEFR